MIISTIGSGSMIDQPLFLSTLDPSQQSSETEALESPYSYKMNTPANWLSLRMQLSNGTSKRIIEV